MSKDAILLSSGFILVAMGRYDYPNEKGKDCLELWSIPNTFDPQNPEIPSLCATFQLANFDRWSSREIYLKSEGRTVETEFKFRPAPQQLVLISHEGHEFVVSINALLTRIPTQTTHLDGPPIYSWTEWGPQSTLLLPQNYFREMIIWSGNRIVFPDKIWDFSPYAARGPNAPKMSPVTWKCNQCERNCPYSVSKGRHLPFRVIPWKYPKPKEMFLLTMVLVETVNGPQVLRSFIIHHYLLEGLLLMPILCAVVGTSVFKVG